MPSEMSTVTGEQSVEALRRELAEVREQQAATVEILASISSSVTDANQVFAKIAASAARLCDANDATIFQVDGDLLRRVANNASIPQYETRGDDTMPLTREVVGGRAVLDGKTIQIADVQAEMGEYPEGSHRARRVAHRTILAVPLMRVGEAIGVIAIRRTEVRQFTDRQIDLLKTFADQAVIAIENLRLFHETKEALERQTVTAEILKVIASSPSDSQPVFNAIATSANRLLGGLSTTVWRFEGDKGYLAAFTPINATADEALKALSPMRISDTSDMGLPGEGKIVQLRDTEELAPRIRDLARLRGFRAMLFVPLMNQAVPIGCISVTRKVPGAFDPDDVQLLQTFADQAVIAIENARLFEEVQARTRELTERTHELTEALEYQTATSDVLAVISRSKFDLQPTLDAIAGTASRLCAAADVTIFLRDGGDLRSTAHHGHMSMAFPYVRQPIGRDWVAGRTVIDRKPIHVHDLFTAGEDLSRGREIAALAGHRTTLGIPLLREDAAIGCIVLRRDVVHPFAEKQITILQTFADQAVIAIENTRLFEAEQASKRELARSVEELESLGKVNQAVNSSLELDKVLPTILEHACAMSYAGGGTVYVFDKMSSEFRLAAAHNVSDEHIAIVRAQPMRLNSAVVGECATRREVVQVADLSRAAPSPLVDILLRTGVRAVLAVPLLHQAEVVGVLVVRRNQPGTFSHEIIRLVEAFAAQSAIAVENARLFGEIAQKSRELEIASQHKSQFVANMSHELRTPLAAILGYAELMQEGFYEPLGQKSLAALTRIRSNGKHLLGLINTVLDIAKIESGQFTLNMAEYAIESIVETVRSATESLAQNKKIALKTEVAKSLPIGLGDEQRLTQVLLNLVGNAIKFTDAGEVCVTAKAVNGRFAVSVADTGPGIPEQERTRIFDQFHQVDGSLTKAKGGTGLGLAIAKQIVEMHGGRIWVESTLGKGSIFQMELPTRAATT